MTPVPTGFSVDGILQLVKNHGLSLVMAVLFIFGAIGFVPKVYSQLSEIHVLLETVDEQHKNIWEKFDQWANITAEGNRIACATCWNGATDTDEVRRCACSPTR